MILQNRPMTSMVLQRLTDCVSYIGQRPRCFYPTCRNHITQKVRIANQRTLYISLHDDPSPEMFLRVNGSDYTTKTIALYDVITWLMSMALQYGASPSRRSVISS